MEGKLIAMILGVALVLYLATAIIIVAAVSLGGWQVRVRPVLPPLRAWVWLLWALVLPHLW